MFDLVVVGRMFYSNISEYNMNVSSASLLNLYFLNDNAFQKKNIEKGKPKLRLDTEPPKRKKIEKDKQKIGARKERRKKST